MEEEGHGRVNQNVAELLTDRLKEMWRNLMEEFQQSFDSNQLDAVLSELRHLDDEKLEKKVFGNHLLAKSIFKYLPRNDLLACRLMNSYWNEFSTEILLKSKNKIIFNRKINRFYLYESNWKNLDMFTQLLRTSKKFPCNKFRFDKGNLGNDDAQRFFSFYGPSINSIEIVVDDYGFEKDIEKSEDGFSMSLTHSRVIGMILSTQLPNLEHLDLDVTSEEEADWLQSLLFPPEEKVVLPKLKTIKYDAFERGHDFLRQLIKAAINLKSFEFKYSLRSDLGYMDIFIETGKVKSIEGLAFSANDKLGELVKMVEYGPEVKFLSFRDLKDVYKNLELWGKTSTVLSNFLKSSQKSLHTFDSFGSVGFLGHLQLPILENVTDLRLTVLRESAFNPQDIHDHSFAFLPRGSTFSKNFPRLRSVLFLIHSEISNDNAAAWWTKCFPIDEIEIVPSVKKLEIYGSKGFPLLWMEKFSKMFPNVENLSICKIKDFSMVSKIIWTHFTKLTYLNLHIKISSSLNTGPFILDSSFTGIPLEKCKRLEQLSLSTLEKMGGKFRVNPSIVNLKDLQTLDINLEINLDASECTTFLTHLSGPCAFNLLENLRGVNIYVGGGEDETVLSRIKNSVEPLTAYKVNIIEA